MGRRYQKKENPQNKGGGRPSIYTPELAQEICDKIRKGLSLREIEKCEGMPSIFAIWDWLDKKEGFAKQYAQAKTEQAELLADEIVAIADEEMPRDAQGKIDPAAVNQARLRVDARKWVAAKLLPKKYGESQTLRGDAENPLIPSLNLVINK